MEMLPICKSTGKITGIISDVNNELLTIPTDPMENIYKNIHLQMAWPNVKNYCSQVHLVCLVSDRS